MTVAAYPGSFDPLTVAHLAVAAAVVEQVGVDRVDLVLSVDPLGKEAASQVRVRDRVAVIEAVAARHGWLGVRTTEARLVADIAAGYDAVVVGADKWAQVLDPTWYGGSREVRDRAVQALGTVALAPRADPRTAAPIEPPELGLLAVRVVELDLHPDHHGVSATGARAGRRDWMVPEAAAFDEQTGAWSDRDRYRRWVADHP